MWKYGVACVVALLILFRIYNGALHAPFFFDDFTLPFYLTDYHRTPLLDWLSGVRPVVMFTYWLNYRDAALSPHAYHLFNIWLHFINGILVFFLVRKIASFGEQDASKLNILSGFAAALFLMHPIQTDAVAYITGRSDLLCSFLILSAFTIFLYLPANRFFTLYSFAIVLLFAMACGAKETAVVLPVLLLFTDRFWITDSYRAALRKNRVLYGSLAVLALAGMVYVWHILSGSISAGFGLKEINWYQYFFTECRAVFLYLRLLLIPFSQSVDHAFPVSTNLMAHGAWLALALLSLAIWVAWRYRDKYPLSSYGFVFFLLALAPTSSFVPIADPLVERRLYLPMIGILLVAFDALRRLKLEKRQLLLALAVILATSTTLATWRSDLWANPVALWKDAVSKAPAKARPHLGLASALVAAGRCPDALNEFSTADRILSAGAGPNLETLREMLVNWGLAYHCAKQPEAALSKLFQAAKLQPTAHLYSQIGMVYADMGLWARSVDYLQLAIQLDPNYEPTYVYAGNVYMSNQRPDEAIDYYRRAVALNPEDLYAQQALMVSQIRAAKQEKQAASP